MKAVTCLLLFSLAGYVASQYAFKPGKKYTYEVQGRLMTGITELNTQYAGLQLNYKIDLQVISPTTIVLDPREFRAVEVNSEQEGGWRDGELSNETPVEIKEELLKYLESPIELTMRSGVIESIKVEKDLPTWAVNMKKAQASHFVIDSTGTNIVLSGNLNRETNSVRPEERNTDSGYFYETMESTVHGECETYYTISQNGPFDTPYTTQKSAMPGDKDSSEVNSNESMRKRRPNSGESSEDENQLDEQREKYFQKEGKNKYWQPAAYKQFSTYKDLVDTDSSEESSEDRQGERAWPETFDTFCESNDQIYEIVKAINFTTCKNKPVLAYTTSAGLYGRGGDNNIGTAWERAVITRYLACGRDRKQFTILNIKQEEQVNFGLRQDQKTFAGTVQNLTLVSVTKASVPVRIQDAQIIKDLTYDFDPVEQKQQLNGKVPHAYDDVLNDNESSEETTTRGPRNFNSYSTEDESNEKTDSNEGPIYKSTHKRRPRSVVSEEEEGQGSTSQEQSWYQSDADNSYQLPKPSLKFAPINPLLVSPLKTSGMKKRVQDLMKEIIEDITTDKESMAESETLSKISIVAKILRYLNYNDIMELYHILADKKQTSDDQVSRNVFLDAMSISGTNPNIMVQIELIEKKELRGEHAAQILSTIPMYLRTPTEQIIEKLFELTDSAAVESDNDQVKTAAVLALSNLLYQACVNTETMNSRYPVSLYGQFCDQKLVSRKYAPHIIKNLWKHMSGNEPEDRHWVSTYLTALGNLGVEEAVEVVQKILDDEDESYVKVQAVYALKRLLVSRSSLNIPVTSPRGVDRETQDLLTDEIVESRVLPVLVSVAHDKSEHPEVRMAAISLMIYSTSADMTIWQQLAFLTWAPASQEVHSFIYTSLRSLAALPRPSSPLHASMQLKARAVLSLAKPFSGGRAKSSNLFSAAFLEHVQTAFIQHYEFFSSKDSIFPSTFYYRNNIQYGNGAQGANPIEVDFQSQTMQRLINFLVEKVVKKTSISEPHHELERIHEILGISQRDMSEDPQASLRLKLNEDAERLFSINEKTIEELLSLAKSVALPKLLSGLPINYQKTLHLLEHSLEMPSAIGIPIAYHLRMPVHVSLRGNVKIVNENGLKDVQLQAELHPVYAWKTHGKLSFKAPFSGKKYQAGVQRHVVIEMPFRALARKAPRGQYVVAITPSPLTSGSPSGKIDIATFHQKPYTAIITDELFPTVHKEGGKMEIIHAVEEPYKNEEVSEYAQKAFGLTVEVNQESEYHDEMEGQAGWMRFWRRFHTPGCYFNVGWMGARNVRYVQRVVSLDVSKSETKTLALIAAYKYHESPSARDLWEDSSSGSSQSSEESASSESAADSSSAQKSSYEKRTRTATRGERRAHEDAQKDNSVESGRIVAVALIGKRAPIRSPVENRGQIQKILQKENPSTVQYLLQASKSTGRFYVRVASGDAANEAAAALPQSSPSLQALREAVYEAQNTKAQPDGCLEFEGEYDAPKYANRHELIVLRKRLLAEELEVKVKGEVQFGTSCKNMPHEIKVVGKLERGPRMTEWALKKSPQAQKCEEDEKKGFNVSPVCLYVSEQQAAALNKADLKITYSKNLPIAFRNVSYDAEDALKAFLYPYLSNDNYYSNGQERTLRFEAYMTPNKEFVSFGITKPDSKITFEDIKTNNFVKAIFPLTATQALPNNIRDRVLRADSEASCQIEGSRVNTFDNVTYRFDSQVSNECYHVLAKDCSGRHPVAVLVKDATAQRKEVVLLLGAQTKIELNQPEQKGRLLEKSRFQVQVNEENVESLPRVIYAKDSGRQIARIEMMQDGGIQVISRHFQLASNGEYIYLQASNSLRNRTCGLCGDFDGEKVGEFRGPKDCALSSGSLLVASYSFQSLDPKEKAQCKVDENARQRLQHEQQLCLKNAAHFPTQRQQDNVWSKQQLSKLDNQYQSQNPSAGRVDNQCISQTKPAIRLVVSQALNAALKPIEWSTESRERKVNQIADKVANEVESILEKHASVQSIIDAVTKKVCEVLTKVNLMPTWASGAVCKGMKGPIAQLLAVQLIPIAQETNCYEESAQNFNMQEAIKQGQTVLADESDDDDSNYSYIPSRKLPMGCNKMLEEILSQSIERYAYMILLKNKDVTESERRNIKNKIGKAVRVAVKKFIKTKNSPSMLEDEIMTLINPVFPDGPEQSSLNKFIKNLTPMTLQKLCKDGQCCFALQQNIQLKQQQQQQQQQQ